MQTREDIQKFIIIILVQGMYLVPLINMNESKNIQILFITFLPDLWWP